MNKETRRFIHVQLWHDLKNIGANNRVALRTKVQIAQEVWGTYDDGLVDFTLYGILS